MRWTGTRWAGALCAGLLLLTVACGTQPEQSKTTPLPTESQPAVTPSESVPPESRMADQKDLFLSVALRNGLAVVLYSPTPEEIETVSVPEVLTLDDSDGVYFDEVLIVPQYGDCTVSVDRITYEEESGTFTITENLGTLKPGEDEQSAIGGILVRSLLPEGMPALQVTVSREGHAPGAFLLGYDGKGDGVYFIREGDTA